MTNLLKNAYSLYIGGQWLPAENNATFTATNPANGDILATCAEASKADVDKAVQAAHGKRHPRRAASPSSSR